MSRTGSGQSQTKRVNLNLIRALLFVCTSYPQDLLYVTKLYIKREICEKMSTTSRIESRSSFILTTLMPEVVQFFSIIIVIFIFASIRISLFCHLESINVLPGDVIFPLTAATRHDKDKFIPLWKCFTVNLHSNLSLKNKIISLVERKRFFNFISFNFFQFALNLKHCVQS